MPFDGLHPYSPPLITGRINPALVDVRWRHLWDKAEIACVLDQKMGAGTGLFDHSAGIMGDLTHGTGPAPVVDPFCGPAVDWSSDNSNRIVFTKDNPTAERDFTLGVIGTFVAGSFPCAYMSCSANNSGFKFIQLDGDSLILQYPSSHAILDFTPLPTSGETYFWAMSFSKAAQTAVGVDLNLKTGATRVFTNSSTAGPPSANGDVIIGNSAANHFTGGWKGDLKMVFAAEYASTLPELFDWISDPWGPWREIQPVFGKAPAAGGGAAIILDAGAIALAGRSVFEQIDIALGAVSLSMSAKDLKAQIGIDIARGDLTVAGKTLSIDQAVKIAQSALSLAGSDIAVGSTQLVPVAAGILGLSGAQLSDPSILNELYAICRSILRSIVRPGL